MAEMIVTNDRLEQALKKLAQTDAPIAELHAQVERAEFRSKAIKDAIFLRSEGSVAERNAIAGTHPEYGGGYGGVLCGFADARDDEERT